MPQLDFNIVFPQIFWLILIFLSLYSFLIHYFLPNFIKLMKFRKQIILVNSQNLINLQNNFIFKQKNLNICIEKNFVLIKNLLEKEILSLFKKMFLFDLKLVDEKIAKMLYHSIIYYDLSILNSISIKINI